MSAVLTDIKISSDQCVSVSQFKIHVSVVPVLTLIKLSQYHKCHQGNALLPASMEPLRRGVTGHPVKVGDKN